MVEINLHSFPPQEGFQIDLSKSKNFDLHPGEAGEDHTEGQPEPSVTTRPFEGNEVKIGYIEAKPGEAIPWHTHDPDQYQLIVLQQGELAVSYKDEEGEVHSIRTEPHQITYLPPGAHNRLEAVGSEVAKALAIERKTAVSRVEQMIIDEDTKGVYDENKANIALDLDTLRGKVHELDNEVVTRF